jgi:N-acetyl-gamma-glutamyl-phosphate reductase
MSAALKTAVVGATGYAGLELARLLLRHPQLEQPIFFRREGDPEGPSNLGEVFPNLAANGGYPLHPFSWGRVQDSGAQLIFLATPHEISRALVPEAISRGLRVVDLSGAWRLKDEQNSAVYEFADPRSPVATQIMQQAVYGLPELNRTRLSDAVLVANPGCYPTSVILALAPFIRAGMVDRSRGIISDSKSGVSGAGKAPTARTHFVSVADNLSAYSVFGHRHTGEILEQLQLAASELIFTPHLLPIPRGILSTIYVHLLHPNSAASVQSCLAEFYAGCRWVRIFPTPQLPQIQFSLNTNYCDIGFCLADDGRRLVLVSCIDNLLKGAAGQAVQNMNLMYGWNEEAGLN